MGIGNIDTLIDDEIGRVVLGDEAEPGDHDRFAHIVNPPLNTHIWTPGWTAQMVVDYAREQGWWVIALCGKKWVPKRNPDKYPACETCMEEARRLIDEAGE